MPLFSGRVPNPRFFKQSRENIPGIASDQAGTVFGVSHGIPGLSAIKRFEIVSSEPQMPPYDMQVLLLQYRQVLFQLRYSSGFAFVAYCQAQNKTYRSYQQAERKIRSQGYLLHLLENRILQAMNIAKPAIPPAKGTNVPQSNFTVI
jgi:hypothetical protein